MRVPFFAGNWKMNFTSVQARDLARAMLANMGEWTQVEVALAPPHTALQAVAGVLQGSRIGLAAQNAHWETSGAFTGEVSMEMIKEAGCQYVIIGHSERRQYFGETNESVNRKMHAALKVSLKPILCVGETLQERESAQTLPVIKRQLVEGLKNISAAQMEGVTMAYEPVWAIGTGKVATKEQAQEVHAQIRAWLKDLFQANVADRVRIQYGGSVKPDNIMELMGEPDIDGALVGGASLKVDSFLAICRYSA